MPVKFEVSVVSADGGKTVPLESLDGVFKCFSCGHNLKVDLSIWKKELGLYEASDKYVARINDFAKRLNEGKEKVDELWIKFRNEAAQHSMDLKTNYDGTVESQNVRCPECLIDFSVRVHLSYQVQPFAETDKRAVLRAPIGDRAVLARVRQILNLSPEDSWPDFIAGKDLDAQELALEKAVTALEGVAKYRGATYDLDFENLFSEVKHWLDKVRVRERERVSIAYDTLIRSIEEVSIGKIWSPTRL